MALSGTATIMDWQGRPEQALELLAPALAVAGDDTELALSQARLLQRVGRTEEAASGLKAVLAAGGLSEPHRQRLHMIMGDLYDELDQTARAFEHYRIGNGMRGVGFDVAGHSSLIERLIDVFPAPGVHSMEGSECQDQRPVFIFGMPRSGTTLVERILAAHPAICAGGE